MEGDHVYSLGELIDIAESNNPLTRVTWANAKAQAASLGIARSELYPTLVALVVGRTFQEPLLLYEHFQLQDIGLFKSILSLNYTILDFGKRRSEIDARAARLLSANFKFNDAHLQIVNRVTQTYYELQNAIGLHNAAITNLKDAKAVEQAAQERLNNGLATLPDVLEARASAARAEYDLQSTIRTEHVFFGHLASTLTVSPSHSFRIQSLNELQVPDTLDETPDKATERALQQRPDLLELVSNLRKATAEVKHAKSAYYPTLEFEGSAGWLRAWGQQEQLPSIYGQVKIYDAQVNLRWTVFDGLKRESELARAKAERNAAEAEVYEQQDRISDQVWEAYHDAKISLEQRKAAVALLKAASESYDAALESYRYGVRNILDVLAAERDLAHARATDVTARTEVLNSFKELAFRTGDLLTNHPTGNKP